MNDAPCACGSGLRARRCCAPDPALPPASPPADLPALIARARAALARGGTEAAAELALLVLEDTPGQPDMLELLARIRHAAGQAGAAEALLTRLVGIDPNRLWATMELALLLLRRGAVGQAEAHARNAVRLAPENPQAHNLMGMILTELGRPQIGEYHYRRVLALRGQRDPILLANLAWNLKNQGRSAEATALYEESLAAAPQVLQTVLGHARLAEADRDFPRATALLDRAEEVAPNLPAIALQRAVLHGRQGENQAALALLDGIDGAALGPAEWLEKGRLLDRIGRHAEAFAAFDTGKRLARERGGHGYRAVQAEALVGRLRRFFTAPRLRLLPRAAQRTDCPQPIFILGFPRSGTTLVEQTLSAHPAIEAGDELPIIGDLAVLLPRLLGAPMEYPEALAELWMGDQREALDTLRDLYLQRARQAGLMQSGARWFTDKMPLNETHLGLIALLFPASPLIHVLRHPLDVVLSVYSNLLTHGFDCAFDLESAARHYALIADLLAQYRANMALRYLPLRYEALIADQEAEVRRMLAFIGLDFDPACLAFHENRRHARTASYAQVTEKLYRRSVARHRAYARELAPVLPILAPAMARLGYRADD
ncbi:MAG: sulfotransferase [Rhodospirillales bacterium]|nr:sulfotransferase [Rhodospirillales bacterium]